MGPSRSPNKPTAIVLVAMLLVAQPAGAYAATPDDPFESFNRSMYAVHRVLDGIIFGPAARAYKAIVPAKLGKGFRNIINNLKEPAIAANDLLQAHPRQTAKTVARFAINSTLGIGGVFDFAHDMGFPFHSNGFGVTAGRYHVQPGPYLFIPLVGPTNFRDFLGYVADAVTDPLAFQPFSDGQVIYARAIVDGLDQRVQADDQLKQIDAMSTDPYASLRSLFEQNRAAQIQDAITGVSGSAQPELLDFDDPNAAPPAGAAPVSPPPPSKTDTPAAALEPGGAMDQMVDAMLARPLVVMDQGSAGAPAPLALAPVESARAG
jgi:phospholipid-binding lipoprotein MlaA